MSLDKWMVTGYWSPSWRYHIWSAIDHRHVLHIHQKYPKTRIDLEFKTLETARDHALKRIRILVGKGKSKYKKDLNFDNWIPDCYISPSKRFMIQVDKDSIWLDDRAMIGKGKSQYEAETVEEAYAKAKSLLKAEKKRAGNAKNHRSRK